MLLAHYDLYFYGYFSVVSSVVGGDSRNDTEVEVNRNNSNELHPKEKNFWHMQKAKL